MNSYFYIYNSKEQIYFWESNGLIKRKDRDIRDILEKMDIVYGRGKKIAIPGHEGITIPKWVVITKNKTIFQTVAVGAFIIKNRTAQFAQKLNRLGQQSFRWLRFLSQR